MVTNGHGTVTCASFLKVFNNFRTSFWNRLAATRGKEGFPLYRYIGISTQQSVSPHRRRDLNSSVESLYKAPNLLDGNPLGISVQVPYRGQSCSVGLTLSYFLLNAPPFPLNFPVFPLIHFLGFLLSSCCRIAFFPFLLIRRSKYFCFGDSILTLNDRIVSLAVWRDNEICIIHQHLIFFFLVISSHTRRTNYHLLW